MCSNLYAVKRICICSHLCGKNWIRDFLHLFEWKISLTPWNFPGSWRDHLQIICVLHIPLCATNQSSLSRQCPCVCVSINICAYNCDAAQRTQFYSAHVLPRMYWIRNYVVWVTCVGNISWMHLVSALDCTWIICFKHWWKLISLLWEAFTWERA